MVAHIAGTGCRKPCNDERGPPSMERNTAESKGSGICGRRRRGVREREREREREQIQAEVH